MTNTRKRDAFAVLTGVGMTAFCAVFGDAVDADPAFAGVLGFAAGLTAGGIATLMAHDLWPEPESPKEKKDDDT